MNSGAMWSLVTKIVAALSVWLLTMGCESNTDDPPPNPTIPFLVIPTAGHSTPLQYQGYQLLWNDEFTADELSAEHWKYVTGDGCPNLCGWGNNQEQTYTNTPNNSYQTQGNLIIEARREGLIDMEYSSARLSTQDLHEFQYGRIDVRATLTNAVGTQVDISLLNSGYNVEEHFDWWPSGGQIDILQYLGEDASTIYGTAHFGSNLNQYQFNRQPYQTTGDRFTDVYFVFSIIWEEDKITWLVDDQEYHSFTNNDTDSEPYPFNQAFYLDIALAVGGDWPSSPFNTLFPSFLIIDYVRVFQKL